MKRTLICADCGKDAGEGKQGYRAVWECVYGPWRGMPEKWPEPRGEAVAGLDRWRVEGRLFRLGEFVDENGR
ncbi:MAG: hypothetical protein GY869_20615 [Planctomycetes bacterium]|nr:hypothetical protein [Planctomycetota bacterium]